MEKSFDSDTYLDSAEKADIVSSFKQSTNNLDQNKILLN